MTRSFDSWDSLNEGLFNNYLAIGKEKMQIDGGWAVLKYKVKSKTEFKYTIKHDNAEAIFVQDHKLTDRGANIVLTDLNGAAGFIGHIGKLDKGFFATKMLVYTIKRERSKVVTTAFTVVERKVEDLKKMGFDPKVTMVSTTELENAKKATKGINLDSKLEAAASSNKQEAAGANTPESELNTEEEAKGTSKTSSLKGQSFRYTMRTNGVTYKMTFDDKGAIKAEPEDSGASAGSISLEGESIMWYSENKKQDNKSTDKNDLSMDIEIVNSNDKAFLLKMFNDEAYRTEYLNKDKAASTDGKYTIETVKAILFNRKGELIFGDYEGAIANSKSGKEKDANTDEYQEALDAGASAAKRSMKNKA